jgi:hypothetical protein
MNVDECRSMSQNWPSSCHGCRLEVIMMCKSHETSRGKLQQGIPHGHGRWKGDYSEASESKCWPPAFDDRQ